uniref:Peptidase_M13 domain-containing protein n=1 Tax=Steinernema glaseri TaxID=37863 RepID=A0A1I8ARN3_9BILA
MYSHENELNPGKADDLEDLRKAVLREIRDHVMNASWIFEPRREEIVAYLDRSNVIIGVDKKYRNLTLLKEMMDVYDREFAKVSKDHECELEMLSRAHGLARHRLIHSQKSSLMAPLVINQYEDSIAAGNVYHTPLDASTSIQVAPGFIHILNKEFPTAFNYGYVGWAIAQQIFSLMGITDRLSRFRHLRLATFAKKYQDESQCYIDFYERNQFCMDDLGCPGGETKADAGFADVEGARIAFSIFQKDLKRKYDWSGNRVSEEAGPISHHYDGYTDEQWFFIGQQFFACEYPTREEEKKLMEDNPRPRPQIRVNAIVQQMASFTKAFGCKDTQRNYVTEKQCALYTPKDKGQYWERVTSTSAPVIHELISQAASETMTSFYKLYLSLFLYHVIMHPF